MIKAIGSNLKMLLIVIALCFTGGTYGAELVLLLLFSINRLLPTEQGKQQDFI
jgi:hypothetical protein